MIAFSPTCCFSVRKSKILARKTDASVVGRYLYALDFFISANEHCFNFWIGLDLLGLIALNLIGYFELVLV